jgi:hypothetical protein
MTHFHQYGRALLLGRWAKARSEFDRSIRGLQAMVNRSSSLQQIDQQWIASRTARNDLDEAENALARAALVRQLIMAISTKSPFGD